MGQGSSDEGELITAGMVDRQGLREQVRSTLTRLSRTGELPALPAASTAALSAARDPDAGVDALCDVIRGDVGLSARIIRAANSAAYARRVPARTVSEAVLTLGLRKTCDLLVAAGARQLFRSVPRHAEQLWNHALGTALAAEELARETGAFDPHMCFLPGLFHDVGRIGFLLADDEAFGAVHAHFEGRTGMRPETERSWYGFDHAEAGAILVEDWGLASEQVEAIRWHHQPAQADRGGVLAAILGVADKGAYEMGCGGALVSPEDAEARRILGATAEQISTALGRARGAFVVHRELFV